MSYSNDIKKTVVDLYLSGVSAKEIISNYGVSSSSIYKWSKKRLAEISANTVKYDEDFKAQIVAYYRMGVPVSELSQDYGVSDSSIYYWAKKPRYNHALVEELREIPENDNLTSNDQEDDSMYEDSFKDDFMTDNELGDDFMIDNEFNNEFEDDFMFDDENEQQKDIKLIKLQIGALRLHADMLENLVSNLENNC